MIDATIRKQLLERTLYECLVAIKANRHINGILNNLITKCEELIRPLDTGEVTRLYGQVTGFRAECPSCGQLIAPQNKGGNGRKLGLYNPATQRARCPHEGCKQEFAVGLIFWPVVQKSPIWQRPVDTKLSLKALSALREPYHGRVATRKKRAGQSVNLAYPGPTKFPSGGYET